MSDNPYAAPESSLEVETEDPSEVVLASRFKRLVARIIDGLLAGIVAWILALLIPWYGMSLTEAIEAGQAEGERMAMEGFQFDWTGIFYTAMSTELIIEWLVGILIIFALQGYLLAQYGQTIGKLVLGLKIVDYETNKKPSFTTTFGIREVGMNLLNWFPVFALIDILWIFGPPRRCVHDYWSGTKVVNVD